eukprot:gb/GFBE01067666.1/.p1 GENE.gb/GFBE01067666.1/~~gb/GFBE01067666.1/.p1  ORF type:complete len:166 (+),score=21.84 gb/GFBE01067666.1/:1-498(+)
MAMDSTLSAIMKETMGKEARFQRKLKDEQLAAKAALMEASGMSPTVVAAPTKKTSCVLNQLDQTQGRTKNPHAHDGRPRLHDDGQQLLRYGVSAEGQGRAAYLKLESMKGGPTERFGRSVTTAQEIGWTAAAATKTYTSSPFAHRPLIQGQFYRPMGVSFSTGAL